MFITCHKICTVDAVAPLADCTESSKEDTIFVAWIRWKGRWQLCLWSQGSTNAAQSLEETPARGLEVAKFTGMGVSSTVLVIPAKAEALVEEGGGSPPRWQAESLGGGLPLLTREWRAELVLRPVAPLASRGLARLLAPEG